MSLLSTNCLCVCTIFSKYFCLEYEEWGSKYAKTFLSMFLLSTNYLCGVTVYVLIWNMRNEDQKTFLSMFLRSTNCSSTLRRRFQMWLQDEKIEALLSNDDVGKTTAARASVTSYCHQSFDEAVTYVKSTALCEDSFSSQRPHQPCQHPGGRIHFNNFP